MNAQFKEIAKEAFIIAYKENFGNITISCEASGVGRTQYKTWLKDDADFAKRLAEIEPEEIMLDFGEQKLMERIARGDTLATMFLLKTRGKRRGYIEKTEVAHEGDVVKQITVNVVKPNQIGDIMKQIDGDEHKALPEGEIINFDTQTEPGMVVPAYKAGESDEIPLYNHDKGELLDINEDGEYEE
ncbi:MAG: hypothetical protein AN484_09395 [Aphanizomenon flos-aquae WA102]|jgi:hypothetical protein|uniref:Terminase small subunit n=1 Tax=Aphanizomenon flos-aquae WA102 TaxID=1710896 RepID=A0A1B7X3S8_APHFL|nr:MAG: hypothetical protein AN484_09395 [Aphanizomenon flos-aquae WA102]